MFSTYCFYQRAYMAQGLMFEVFQKLQTRVSSSSILVPHSQSLVPYIFSDKSKKLETYMYVRMK